jgi:hypothetical protein
MTGDGEDEEFINWPQEKEKKVYRPQVRKLISSMSGAAQRQKALSLLQRCGLPVENIGKKQLDCLSLEIMQIFLKALIEENARARRLYGEYSAIYHRENLTSVWLAFTDPLGKQWHDRVFYEKCLESVEKLLSKKSKSSGVITAGESQEHGEIIDMTTEDLFH